MKIFLFIITLVSTNLAFAAYDYSRVCSNDQADQLFAQIASLETQAGSSASTAEALAFLAQIKPLRNQLVFCAEALSEDAKEAVVANYQLVTAYQLIAIIYNLERAKCYAISLSKCSNVERIFKELDAEKDFDSLESVQEAIQKAERELRNLKSYLQKQ